MSKETNLDTIYSDIINAVNFQTKDSPAFDQLIKFQKSILNDLILPSPYESSTPDFIDNFSVKIIKNILNTAVSDQSLINTFSTILENYVRILTYFFDQPNFSFLQSATQITNPNNIFYTSISKKSPPKNYTKIINLFKTKNFYEQITNFFERNTSVPLKQVSILINLLISIKEKTESYCNCINFIFQKTIQIFRTYNYDDLRDIDDKLLNSTLDSIFSLEFSFLDTNLSLNFQLEINIKFAKSEILEKRFNGINKIISIMENQSKNTNNQILEVINKEKILDSILNDFHHQLVNPFVSILKFFIQNKFDVQAYLVAFWKVSISQNSSIAPEFFSGWKNLFSDKKIKKTILNEYSNALFGEISVLANFPEASFSFLDEISSNANDEQKEQVFTSLLVFSSSKNSNIDQALTTTILNYMPKNDETIIKETLEMIENNFHIQLANSIISNFKMNSEQSNQYLVSLLDILNEKNSMETIDLLTKFLDKIGHVIEEQQFNKILEIYLPHLKTGSEKVVSFFMNLSSKSIFSPEMKKELYIRTCELKTFKDSFIPLILYLFKSINVESKTKNSGIELLLEIAFKTVNEDLIVFLNNQIGTVEYVENCMINTQTQGSLNCLYKIITIVEQCMNNHVRSVLKLPLINQYIDNDFLIPVKLIGYVELTLNLTKSTPYSALKFFISLLTKININNLVLYINGSVITNLNEKINGQITIEIKSKISSGQSFKFEIDTEMPSMILFSNATYTLNLMSLLDDERLGEISLKILNKMPTIQNYEISFEIEENDQIDKSNEFKNCGWEWNKFLTFDSPNHLIYHLNTIGNYLNKNDDEWNRWFFNTGGAFRLVDLLLKSKNSMFNLLDESNQKKFTEKEFLLLLLVVNRMLLIEKDEEMNEIIRKIENIEFIEFLNYSSEIFSNEKSEDISYYLISIIKKITLIRGIKDDKEVIDLYISLFGFACFHKTQKISKLANDFLHEKEIHSSHIMIQLLPKAVYKNNSDFINSILSLVSKEPDSKELIWNTLLDSVFKLFSPLNNNKDVKDIWSNLNIIYPNDEFIQTLLSSFVHLIDLFNSTENGENKEIPRIEELFFLLFDDILYNKVVYFKISPTLINLLNSIIYLKPSLINDLTPRIKEIQEEMKMVKSENNKPLKLVEIENNKGPSYHIKGLRNLGATCYMDSILQQLYSIPILRASLLSLEIDLPKNESSEETSQTEANYSTSQNGSSEETSQTYNNYSTAQSESNEEAFQTYNDNSAAQNGSSEKISQNENNEEGFQNNNDNSTSQTDTENLTAQNESNEESSQNNYNESTENTCNNDKEEDDFKWLYELQYLFLKMLIYPKSSSAINPSNFINEWKGSDEILINPHHQQDAEEHLSLILSRLEPKLSTIDTLFRGQIENHVQGEGEYKQYSRNFIENYFDITLEVKGHNDISSSLEAFKAPEKFEGKNKYQTEELGSIDATQTHLILRDSPILIITLKRIQFNMTTFVKEKINSRYEFPLSLDISPILVDKEKENNPMYELYGVIIHIGTADAGHYISHIKDASNNWRCFNDSLVQVETVDEMYKASLGKNPTKDDDSDIVAFENGSAYILFYRQVGYDFNCKNGFEEGNLPIASNLINRLALDIKKDILTNISLSKEYFMFVTSIIQDVGIILSLLADDSGVSAECKEIIMNICLDKCNSNESKEFIDSILSYYATKSIEYIDNNDIEDDSIITNKSLIDLVTKSLTKSSSSSENFINGLIQKVTEIQSIEPIEKKLDVYAKNIILFYDVVGNKNNQLDTSNSVNLLIDFVTKYKNNNIGSIINLLIKMDTNNKGINNLTNFFTDDILLNYLVNNDSIEFLSIFIKRIKEEPSKLDIIFKINSKGMTNLISVFGKMFICILSSKTNKPTDPSLLKENEGKNYMEIFFSTYLKEQNKEKVFSIFKYVDSIISNFITDTFNNFIYYSDFLIDKLLFSYSFEVRQVITSLFQKFIFIGEKIFQKSKDAFVRSLFTIYSSLVKRMTSLQSKIISKINEKNVSYSDLKNSLQDEQYFFILTNIVNIGHFNNNVLNLSVNLANFLISTTPLFARFKGPCFVYKHVIDFITETVSKENSINFFGKQGETLKLFIQGIPLFSQSHQYSEIQIEELEDYADSIIKFIVLIPVHLFRLIASTYFLSVILKSTKYMQSQYAYELYKQLCNYLNYLDDNSINNFANIFFFYCLDSHLETGRRIPLKIGIYLLKKNPKLTVIFYDNNFYQKIWSLIFGKISEYLSELNKNRIPVDSSVFPLMHLLGVFISQFSLVPENRSDSYWDKSKHYYLSSYFENNSVDASIILKFSLFENSASKSDDMFNSKGSFVFLRSLFSLDANKVCKEIYEALLPFLLTDNGFIEKVPKKSKLAASKLMLTVLRWAKKSTSSLPNEPYSIIIYNEFSRLINSIFRRDNQLIEKVDIKDKKIDCQILNLLSEEAQRYYYYCKNQSLNELLQSFKLLMSYPDGAFYFNSKELIEICINTLLKNKIDPLNWIKNIQKYVLNLINEDYSNDNARYFANAARVIDEIMEKFDIKEIPRIQMDEKSKENQDRWAQLAQSGQNEQDEFVLVHLLTILVPE